MCKTISVINQKGGVGKTTTSINLAVSLVKMGKKVLAVDLDSQANLTMGMGYADPDDISIKLADLLQVEIAKRTTGQKSNVYGSKEDFILTAHGVDFIPSSLDLAGLELVLMNTIGRETVLKSFLEQFRDDYDFILIDCLPSLGIFTVNALTASDEIIIPVQAQYFGAKGVEALLQSVTSVQTYLNPKLKVLGILITMLDGRSTFQKEVGKIVHESFSDYTNIFNTAVPLSVEVSKQQSQGLPIVALRNNRVSEAYNDFAAEVLRYE
jgi:chromosome partitioning protein